MIEQYLIAIKALGYKKNLSDRELFSRKRKT